MSTPTSASAPPVSPAEFGYLLGHAWEAEVCGPFPTMAAAEEELTRVLRAQPGAVGWVMARTPRQSGWQDWRTVAAPHASAAEAHASLLAWARGEFGSTAPERALEYARVADPIGGAASCDVDDPLSPSTWPGASRTPSRRRKLVEGVA